MSQVFSHADEQLKRENAELREFSASAVRTIEYLQGVIAGTEPEPHFIEFDRLGEDTQNSPRIGGLFCVTLLVPEHKTRFAQRVPVHHKCGRSLP